MFVHREKLKKEDLGGGVIMQYLGCSNNMNVLHWNIADGGEVKLHSHEHEQFGYVIKTLGEGDCYFIGSKVPHTFVAIGETEAIDVFSPFRTDLPGTPKDIRPFSQ